MKWSEASDISIVAAALALMGHDVVSLGDTGDTNLAIARGVNDVSMKRSIGTSTLSELDSADCAIVFMRPGIQEEVNDLGIIVDNRWVYLRTGADLEMFAEAAVNRMARENIII